MKEWWRALAERLGLHFEEAFVDDRGALLCTSAENGEPDLERTLTWVEVFHGRRLASWALDRFGAGERWLVLRMSDDVVGPDDRRALSSRLGLRLHELDAAEAPSAGWLWAEAMAAGTTPPREPIAFDVAELRARAEALSYADSALPGIQGLLERLGAHRELEGGDDGYVAVWTLRLGRLIAAMKGEASCSEASLRRVLPAVLDARAVLFPEARLEGGTVRGVLRSLSTQQVR